MRFITNRLFLQVTLTLSLLIATLVILTRVDLCESGSACGLFVKTIEPLGFLLFIPILLLPLAATFNLIDNRIFVAWKKFAVWAIPVLLVLTYLATRDIGGSNFFSMDFGLYFLGLIYGLFFLISLIVIFVAARK